MPATLLVIAATGFAVAFFHAAIPTHWLPFVLVARARRWNRAKTLGVTLAASLGHLAIMTILGLLIAMFGFEIEHTSAHLFSWIAGGALLAVGLYYFWRQWRGDGICHHLVRGSHHHANPECGHDDGPSHWDEELRDSTLVSQRAGDWAAMSGLFIMLTLSPCEGFLLVYLSAVQFGWTGFFVLSGILVVATLLGMLLFTWLALLGLQRVEIRAFERYEAALLGTVFSLLALIVLTLSHGGEV